MVGRHHKKSKGKLLRNRVGRPGQVFLPLSRNPAPMAPAPPPPSLPVATKPEEPKSEINAAFWRPLLSALGTRPMGLQVVTGASGIEHRAVEVGVDAERKRIIVINDSPDPMAAAFVQSDLQRTHPDQRVIVTRTTLVNVGATLRDVATAMGFSAMRLQELIERIQQKKFDQTLFNGVLESVVMRMAGDPKVKAHSAGAVALQAINQLTRLNWSDVVKDDMAESVVSIDSMLSGLDSDTERQLGICMVPMYSVSADEVDNVKSSSSLDPARQLLERLGVWEYFFPDSECLALGLVDRGFDEPQKLEEAIVLAPKNGHLINEREEVPKLDGLLANLQAKGLVCEVEAKLKVDIGGQKVRATVKIKPQEALLVKLKQLASLTGPISKLAEFIFTGNIGP